MAVLMSSNPLITALMEAFGIDPKRCRTFELRVVGGGIVFVKCELIDFPITLDDVQKIKTTVMEYELRPRHAMNHDPRITNNDPQFLTNHE